MSGEKFLLMISNARIFQKLTKDMKSSFDERELLSKCEVARVNVIPSEKYIEIFLEVPQPISKRILQRVVEHVKAKFNPEGEVTISPRPHYDATISLFESQDPADYESKYGKVSTKDKSIGFDGPALQLILSQRKFSSETQRNVDKPANTPTMNEQVNNVQAEPSDIKAGPKEQPKASPKSDKPKAKDVPKEAKKITATSTVKGQADKISKVTQENQKVVIEGKVMS